ncbi:MAG TPA: hypothetical protein VF706_02825 [Solirubrobacteraceae bacterium]
MAFRTVQRSLVLIAATAAVTAAAAAALGAHASTYGKLLVRHDAAPSASLETRFAHVRPPGSFLLVVTEPTDAPLEFSWSLRCVSASRRESGGASGKAIVSSGHWVKRERADWIKRPAVCMGSISGSAAASPVLVRIFAD